MESSKIFENIYFPNIELGEQFFPSHEFLIQNQLFRVITEHDEATYCSSANPITASKFLGPWNRRVFSLSLLSRLCSPLADVTELVSPLNRHSSFWESLSKDTQAFSWSCTKHFPSPWIVSALWSPLKLQQIVCFLLLLLLLCVYVCLFFYSLKA